MDKRKVVVPAVGAIIAVTVAIVFMPDISGDAIATEDDYLRFNESEAVSPSVLAESGEFERALAQRIEVEFPQHSAESIAQLCERAKTLFALRSIATADAWIDQVERWGGQTLYIDHPEELAKARARWTSPGDPDASAAFDVASLEVKRVPNEPGAVKQEPSPAPKFVSLTTFTYQANPRNLAHDAVDAVRISVADQSVAGENRRIEYVFLYSESDRAWLPYKQVVLAGSGRPSPEYNAFF